MRKRTLCNGLVLLVANLILEALAIGGFICLVFRGEVVLGWFTVIIALLGTLPQPWFYLFLSLPYGPYYTFIATTIVTILVYRWLWHLRPFTGLHQRLQRIGLRKVVISGVMLLALIGTVGVARHYDVPPLYRHVPPMVESVSDVKTITETKSYRLAGSPFASEWIWQATVPRAEMSRILAQFHLSPIPVKKLPKDFFTMSPYWWRPKITPMVHAYATLPIAEIRDRGEMFMVALWDGQSQQLYMWMRQTN